MFKRENNIKRSDSHRRHDPSATLLSNTTQV
jgi:hypothetical protein